MQQVPCGKLGLVVGKIGLGCMSLSHTYGLADVAQSIRALEAALEVDMTFWDTADVYGMGHNERLLSGLLKSHRSRIVLATKCGIEGRDSSGSLIVNGRPDYIHRCCEASLKRLNIDTIDLYFLHRVDPKVPIEESVGAMGELVKRGLVRYIGLSEPGVDSVQRAQREFALSAVQSEYSLFTRHLEADMLPLLQELGIGLVAYSPLGRGVLTGNLKSTGDLAQDDFRRQLPRFSETNLQKNQKLVEQVQSLARGYGCTAGQLALAWVLSRPNIVAIPGTKRAERVRENAEAAHIVLSEKILESLDFPAKAVAGSRYSPELEKAVGV